MIPDLLRSQEYLEAIQWIYLILKKLNIYLKFKYIFKYIFTIEKTRDRAGQSIVLEGK